MSIQLTKAVAGVVIDGMEMNTHPEHLNKKSNPDAVVKIHEKQSDNIQKPKRDLKDDQIGRSVSGKFWKNSHVKSSSRLNYGFVATMELKNKQSEKLKEMRALTRERKRQIIEKMERRKVEYENNKARKEQNTLKSSTYQIVSQ